MTEEMIGLDLSTKGKDSSSLSESPEPPMTRMQHQYQQFPGLDEMHVNRGGRFYKSLGSEIRAPAREFKANAAIRSHKNNMMRSERSQTRWHGGDFGDFDMSPELVKSIYGGVSKEVRGKRFALLTIDESGRWRVAHSQRPAKTFPGNED